jgi:sialic acid synthase SpsE
MALLYVTRDRGRRTCEAVIPPQAQRSAPEQRLSRPLESPAVYIVAEISGNHGGIKENALRLIDAAKRAGADAVKFQCFEPEALAAKRVGVMWHGKPMTYDELVALYRKTHTPKAWFPELIRHCRESGIEWFASVFGADDVIFLEALDCPRYKISAYEMLDGDLINAVSQTGKPVIFSVRPTERITILEATDYDGNLLPLGLSDHSKAGMPQHRPMIERHIMLPDVPNEDQEFSSTPDEFAAYVGAIR